MAQRLLQAFAIDDPRAQSRLVAYKRSNRLSYIISICLPCACTSPLACLHLRLSGKIATCSLARNEPRSSASAFRRQLFPEASLAVHRLLLSATAMASSSVWQQLQSASCWYQVSNAKARSNANQLACSSLFFLTGRYCGGKVICAVITPDLNQHTIFIHRYVMPVASVGTQMGARHRGHVVLSDNLDLLPQLGAFEHLKSSATCTPGSQDITWESCCISFRDSVGQLVLQTKSLFPVGPFICGTGWRLLDGQGARAEHLHSHMEQVTSMLELAHWHPTLHPCIYSPDLPEMCNPYRRK